MKSAVIHEWLVNPIKMPDSLSDFYHKIAEIHLSLSSVKVELIVVKQFVI